MWRAYLAVEDGGAVGHGHRDRQQVVREVRARVARVPRSGPEGGFALRHLLGQLVQQREHQRRRQPHRQQRQHLLLGELRAGQVQAPDVAVEGPHGREEAAEPLHEPKTRAELGETRRVEERGGRARGDEGRPRARAGGRGVDACFEERERVADQRHAVRGGVAGRVHGRPVAVGLELGAVQPVQQLHVGRQQALRVWVRVKGRGVSKQWGLTRGSVDGWINKETGRWTHLHVVNALEHALVHLQQAGFEHLCNTVRMGD